MDQAPLKQVDRVSFSYGMKVSDGNYGSKDVHFSYSTDVDLVETKESAMHRAREFVMANVSVMNPSAPVAPPAPHQQPQQAPPVQSTAPPNDDLGGYVVGFGKHKGMTLSTIDKLDGYLKYMKSLDNPRGKVAEFINEATMYLNASNPSGGFNPGEEIPF